MLCCTCGPSMLSLQCSFLSIQHTGVLDLRAPLRCSTAVCAGKVPVFFDDVVGGGRGERSRARRAKQPGVYYLVLHVCSDITACTDRHLLIEPALTITGVGKPAR